MNTLLSRISQNPNFGKLTALLASGGQAKLQLSGLAGSAKSFAVAAAFADTGTTFCLVLPDKESASYSYDDLVGILGEESVMFYPSGSLESFTTVSLWSGMISVGRGFGFSGFGI